MHGCFCEHIAITNEKHHYLPPLGLSTKPCHQTDAWVSPSSREHSPAARPQPKTCWLRLHRTDQHLRCLRNIEVHLRSNYRSSSAGTSTWKGIHPLTWFRNSCWEPTSQTPRTNLPERNGGRCYLENQLPSCIDIYNINLDNNQKTHSNQTNSLEFRDIPCGKNPTPRKILLNSHQKQACANWVINVKATSLLFH